MLHQKLRTYCFFLYIRHTFRSFFKKQIEWMLSCEHLTWTWMEIFHDFIYVSLFQSKRSELALWVWWVLFLQINKLQFLCKILKNSVTNMKTCQTLGTPVSTGVWEDSGPESEPALWCLRWPRPAYLRLRWYHPAQLHLRWSHPARLRLR